MHYRLVDLKKGRVYEDRKFVSKEQAKKVRDMLPGGRDRFAVSRSEDHPKGPSWPKDQISLYREVAKGRDIPKPKRRRSRKHKRRPHPRRNPDYA